MRLACHSEVLVANKVILRYSLGCLSTHHIQLTWDSTSRLQKKKRFWGRELNVKKETQCVDVVHPHVAMCSHLDATLALAGGLWRSTLAVT